MKIKTMRRIDGWLGVPLCMVLTLVRRMVELFRPNRSVGPANRIALVKLAEMGAIVVAWPALRRAVELVGRENVFFVTFEQNRDAVETLEAIPVENVITIATSGARALIGSALTAIRDLRRSGVDTVVDMEFFSCMSAAFTCLTRARRRAGLHRTNGRGPYRGNLMTRPVGYAPQLHTWQLFAMMLETAVSDGAPCDADAAATWPEPALPRFKPSAEEIAAVQAMTFDGESPAGSVILLNPNCSDLLPSRQWPEERYVDLAGRILSHYPDSRIVMTGSAADAPAVQELVRQIGSPRCISLAARTSFRQLLTLYCLSDVLVTNDSGPAHFAALTAIDTIVLFGPETPSRWSALGDRSHVLWKNLSCSPCINPLSGRRSRCQDNRCMAAITVDEVFAELCRVCQRRAEVHSA